MNVYALGQVRVYSEGLLSESESLAGTASSLTLSHANLLWLSMARGALKLFRLMASDSRVPCIQNTAFSALS